MEDQYKDSSYVRDIICSDDSLDIRRTPNGTVDIRIKQDD